MKTNNYRYNILVLFCLVMFSLSGFAVELDSLDKIDDKIQDIDDLYGAMLELETQTDTTPAEDQDPAELNENGDIEPLDPADIPDGDGTDEGFWNTKNTAIVGSSSFAIVFALILLARKFRKKGHITKARGGEGDNKLKELITDGEKMKKFFAFFKDVVPSKLKYAQLAQVLYHEGEKKGEQMYSEFMSQIAHKHFEGMFESQIYTQQKNVALTNLKAFEGDFEHSFGHHFASTLKKIIESIEDERITAPNFRTSAIKYFENTSLARSLQLSSMHDHLTEINQAIVDHVNDTIKLSERDKDILKVVLKQESVDEQNLIKQISEQHAGNAGAFLNSKKEYMEALELDKKAIAEIKDTLAWLLKTSSILINYYDFLQDKQADQLNSMHDFAEAIKSHPERKINDLPKLLQYFAQCVEKDEKPLANQVLKSSEVTYHMARLLRTVQQQMLVAKKQAPKNAYIAFPIPGTVGIDKDRTLVNVARQAILAHRYKEKVVIDPQVRAVLHDVKGPVIIDVHSDTEDFPSFSDFSKTTISLNNFARLAVLCDEGDIKHEKIRILLCGSHREIPPAEVLEYIDSDFQKDVGLYIIDKATGKRTFWWYPTAGDRISDIMISAFHKKRIKYQISEVEKYQLFEYKVKRVIPDEPIVMEAGDSARQSL